KCRKRMDAQERLSAEPVKKYTSLCINYQRNFEEEVWRYTDILLQRVG
ncbi:MAG: hypothetical protein HW411_1562, partial [Gammaproteobacteria bacterium]|nr:hypothetical protein [Gammaproteobacteria bacterium]